MEFNHRKIVIIGLGLIGGSIARGLAARHVGGELVAVGRHEATLKQALADGVISGYALDAATACRDADLVIIAVPGLTVEQVLRELAGSIRPDTVITDAASVKQSVVDAAAGVFGEVPVNFVPGHPIAGSEQSGYGAARDNLFAGKKVILTPLAHTADAAVQRVTTLWESLGAQVLIMDIARHDAVLAATSHLPHLLAYALVDTLSQQDESEEIFRYVAGGFRDFTRIASSDPQMWHDIFMTNGEATVDILDCYIEDLNRLRQALLDRDSAYLLNTFTRAKKARDTFLAALENTGIPDSTDEAS